MRGACILRFDDSCNFKFSARLPAIERGENHVYPRSCSLDGDDNLYFNGRVQCFGLRLENPFFYLIARAIAPIGAIFTFITLVTGAIWGKPIWGTWWVWDARLTSVLILFFLYLGYIILLDAFDDREKGEKIAAIISIVGFINVPLIKFSVEYFNSLHQPASIMRSGGVAIDSAMLYPLLLTFGLYFSYFVFISLIKVKSEILLKKSRVR